MVTGLAAGLEGWGLEDDKESDFVRRVYAAQLKFGPGSHGDDEDLYMLEGDALTGPLMVLRRADDGTLLVS